MSTSTVVSDTNVILKLILLEEVELHELKFSKYGILKFHWIVDEEITEWKRKHARRGKHKKIDKFGLQKIEKAIEISRTNKLVASQIRQDDLDIMVEQYEAIALDINSHSSPPTENDWKVLAYSEVNGHYLVTNDDLLQKVGEKVCPSKSLVIEDLIRNLWEDEVLTTEQVKAYAQRLNDYGESFRIGKVLTRLSFPK